MDPYIILAKTEQGAWIGTKEIGTRQWSKQEQLIRVQGEDSKKGQLIYLMWKGSFQIIFLQNDQISIREIKQPHETGQNSKNKHFEVESSIDWSFHQTLTDSVIPWHISPPKIKAFPLSF